MEGQIFFQVSKFVSWGPDGNPIFKGVAMSPNLTGCFQYIQDNKLTGYIIQITNILVANGIPERGQQMPAGLILPN